MKVWGMSIKSKAMKRHSLLKLFELFFAKISTYTAFVNTLLNLRKALVPRYLGTW